MEIFKKIAKFFAGEERTAPQEPEPVTMVAPTTSKERACKVKKLGETEVPLFIPQALMQWYGLYQALNTGKPSFVDISQVEMLELFNPLSSAFVATAFALKSDNKFIWGEVGTRTVYASEEDAFIYKRAATFRILMKKNETTSIKAICRYEKDRIVVDALIRETFSPPLDSDNEQFIPFPLAPCNLSTAAKFIEKIL